MWKFHGWRQWICAWKVSVRCWVTLISNQYGAKSWLVTNFWQFSQGKLPQLHDVIGRIVIMMWQCVKVVLLTCFCSVLFWVTWAVLWTHKYQTSNFVACSVVCSVPSTPVGTGRWSCCFWDMNVVFAPYTVGRQQGQFSQENPDLGTGPLVQSFQNLIARVLSNPR